MKVKLLIAGCFLLAVSSQAAFAQTVYCNYFRGLIDADVRVRACTDIITSPSSGPDEKASAYASRGEARTDAGAIRLALDDFNESIRIKKDNMAAFAGRGRAKLVVGDLTGSIADYSEAIRLSPGTAELYVERGHVYLASGDADAAIRDETEALRLEPQSAIALNERGVAYFKKGDLAAAQQDLTDALKKLPAAEIYANRGNVDNAQNNTADAIRDFRQALLDDPSLVQARDALRRLGALEPAVTQTDQRVHQGRLLAEKNCSRCHAVEAGGTSPNKEAPAFRNLNQRHPLYWLRQPSTRGIQATHEQMPKFNVSPSEIDTIVAYINSLSPGR